MTFKKIIFFLFSLIFIFALPVRADEGWVINNFQSNIDILQSGKIEVLETIDVDFGSLQKHGIYRDVPNYYYFDNNASSYADIEVESITQNGSPANYKKYQQGNYLRLQIGDANITHTGKLEYQIKYLATGVLRSFKDHDELYWDATGNGWPVPIAKVSASVTLPQNGITGALCFEGQLKSGEKCTFQILSKTNTTFQSLRQLNSSEGMTIVLGYTKDMVPILTVTPPSVPPSYSSSSTPTYPPNGLIFLITSVLGIGFIIWLWRRNGQEVHEGHEAIVVEYSPPQNLRPAEIGTLIDERADTLDVSATIVDLAVRGYLTIEEKDKKWVFGSTDYIFTKLKKDESGLLDFDKHLLTRIFADGEIIKLSELEKKFYDDLVEVKNKLYQDMTDRKFFLTNPEKVKQKYRAIGGILLVIGIFPSIGGFFEPSGIINAVGVAIVITGFLLVIFAGTFPRRTPLGYQVYRQILGFKLFMDKVETYKQRFMEKENLFNELLPYAIVFGITEKFAQAFKDLGITPPKPSWYISSRPFNPIMFGSSMNSFTNSLTSSIAAQPTRNSFASSGSGFSGGFSGGGFGGGGGGSW